jgi:hypothetical protein
MAQAFRDDCRRVQVERSFAGVLSLWILVASDLVVTATQEHLSKEGRMSRATFVRVAGAVALLGGALNGLSFLTHPQGLARAVVPASVAALIVGILGLHALLWGREGRLGLLGFLLVGAGMLLWGIVTLRERALGRWSILPLVMSVFGLSGIVFLIPEAFAALEHSAMPEVFALSWILFGFALLTSRFNPSPVPTPVAAA